MLPRGLTGLLLKCRWGSLPAVRRGSAAAAAPSLESSAPAAAVPPRRRPGEPAYRSEGSDDPLGEHGIGHLDESGDIGAGHVVARCAIVLGSAQATVVDGAHDLAQPAGGVV